MRTRASGKGDKTRIDQKVAYGLRARAYLYMGKYAEAAADAAKHRGYTPYSREEVSTPAFYSINDHNWIWGISITASDVTKNGGNPSWPSHLGSFSGSAYAAAVGVYKRINTLLYDQIPDTDIRKQCGWMKTCIPTCWTDLPGEKPAGKTFRLIPLLMSK